MEQITLWHGSQKIIEKPIFGKGKAYNDYGRGFYCTEHISLAKEWACADRNGGYANQYLLECSGLKILDLNQEFKTILHWLAILADNRRFQVETAVAKQGLSWLRKYYLPDLGSYDLIRGYRADDSYFSFARAFVGNAISLGQLSEAMYLGELGEQIVLKSERAFQNLTFTGFEAAEGELFYLKRMQRDEEARAAYRMLAMKPDLDGIFMRDILREEMMPNDVRLQ